MKKSGVKIGFTLAVVASLLCLTAPARADRLFDVSNIGREGTVRSVNERGIVLAVKATGTEQAFPLSQVKRIAVDGVPELERADVALAEGEAEKAIELYRRAQTKTSGKAWMKDYINARLVQAFADSDKSGDALKTYVELVRAKSPLAGQVKVPAVGQASRREADAVLATINAALSADASNPHNSRLKELKIAILIERGDPKEVLPLIEEQLKSQDVETRTQARLKQIDLHLQTKNADAALQSLELARKEVDAAYQPQLFFAEGRAMYLKEQYVAAGLSFMRVPVMFGAMNKALAAESLVWAGKSLQKAGAAEEEIRAVLVEAARDYAGTKGAEAAVQMLKEMDGEQQGQAQQAAK